MILCVVMLFVGLFLLMVGDGNFIPFLFAFVFGFVSKIFSEENRKSELNEIINNQKEKFEF